MSMVEELKACISSAHDIEDTRQDCDVAMFLRERGQALVECVERAMRYEAVRKMNPPTFTKVYMENVKTNIAFDTLVDAWAFNNGYPSLLDPSRTKAGAGGGT